MRLAATRSLIVAAWHLNSSSADWLLLQCAALLISLPVLVSQIHAQTQADMNAQARAEFAQADGELNKTYEALLAKLPDVEGKEKLKQPASVDRISQC